MSSIKPTTTLCGEFAANRYAASGVARALEQVVRAMTQYQIEVLVSWADDTEKPVSAKDFDAVRVVRDLTTHGLRIDVIFRSYGDIHISLKGMGTSVQLEVITSGEGLTHLVFAGVRDALDLRPIQPTALPGDFFDLLHPLVKQVSGKLFADGHYSDAILKSCIALSNEVQQRSGRADIDGAKLMQHVLGADSSVLRLSSDADEQRGLMWLFSGVMMALRNPNAHRITQHPSQEEAIEWLGCISALFRVLDRAQMTPQTS